MKNAIIYTSMLLMCLITSCGSDEDPPTPALSIEPSTAIHFSAAATESYDIIVTTNQDSWDAISNQAWCKVSKSGNKFTVTAVANTTETSPSPATITISAGSAKSITLAVTQDAVTTTDVNYPKTEPELIKAIAKVWIFPETSDYVSLELDEAKNYSLLSKSQITVTRSETVGKFYLMEGTYTVSEDLRIITLSNFGKVEIKELKAEDTQIAITPTGGTAITVTTTEQKAEVPPATTVKHLKTYTADFGQEEGTMKYTLTYKDDKLSSIILTANEQSETIILKHEDKAISFTIPGNELGEEKDLICTYAINNAGRATSLKIVMGKETITQRYTYDGNRRLISVRRYEGGNMTAFCNAIWNDDNISQTSYSRLHVCTDESYVGEDGKTIYSHDHNNDGKFDGQDKVPAGTFYDPTTSNYTYDTSKTNKGKFLIPQYAPEIFDMFDFGDWLAAMAGILGKLPKNLNTDNDNGFFTFEYTYDNEGYPKAVKANAQEHGEEFSATITFE